MADDYDTNKSYFNNEEYNKGITDPNYNFHNEIQRIYEEDNRHVIQEEDSRNIDQESYMPSYSEYITPTESNKNIDTSYIISKQSENQKRSIEIVESKILQKHTVPNYYDGPGRNNVKIKEARNDDDYKIQQNKYFGHQNLLLENGNIRDSLILQDSNVTFGNFQKKQNNQILKIPENDTKPKRQQTKGNGFKAKSVVEKVYHELGINSKRDVSSQIQKRLLWPANEDIADLIVELEKINMLDEIKNEIVPIPLSSRIGFFASKYGLAPLYFFALLRALGILLFIMSLMSAPAIYMNYIGDGITEDTNLLVSTTIGNTKKYVKLDTESTDDYYLRKAEGLKWNSHILIISDLSYSVTFFLFVIYWRIKSASIFRLYHKVKRDTSHYSVQLRGFPNEQIHEKELYDLFKKLDIKVNECAFARRYGNTLFYSSKISKLNEIIAILKIKQMKVSEKRAIKIQLDLEKQNDNMQKLKGKLAIAMKKRYESNYGASKIVPVSNISHNEPKSNNVSHLDTTFVEEVSKTVVC